MTARRFLRLTIEWMSRRRAIIALLKRPTTAPELMPMSDFDPRTPQKKKFPTAVSVLVILAVALLAGGYSLAPRFERDAPVITLTPDSALLGKAPMEIGVTDRGAGLK